MIAAALSLISLEPANPFSSFKVAGGSIHHSIISDALVPSGLASSSLKMITRGMNSQDNPFSKKWTIPENHSCNNEITKSFEYIEARTQEAARLSGEISFNPRIRKKALYSLGEAFHALHDFYSHSNYVEWLIQNDKPLIPIDRRKIPAEIRTCYYMYENIFCQEPFRSHEKNVELLEKTYPNVHFRTRKEYQNRKADSSLAQAIDYSLRPGQLLHMEINKDNNKQLQGKVFSLKHGKTLHELAYQLAVDDTKIHWKQFEELVIDMHGEKAPLIISALKGCPITIKAKSRQVKTETVEERKRMISMPAAKGK